MDEKTLRESLTRCPVTDLQFYESAGSTNDLALSWMTSKAPDSALVIADAQTAGRGRMNRRWVTKPHSALAFSLICRPHDEEMGKLPLFAPLAGLAVSRALENMGLAPEIKWPNDVLLDRRKVCGVLVEAAWMGNILDGLVVGIGVNIAPSSVPPLNELMFPAGCVEQALGKPVDRIGLLTAILNHFFEERPHLGSEQFLKEWERRLAFRGETVQVEPPGKPIQVGTLVGIDGEGNLVLLTRENNKIVISAGDVARLRPMV